VDATSTRFRDTGIGLRVALQNHPSAMGFRMLVREVMEKELAAGYVVEWKWRDVLPWFILLVGAVAKLHATRMSRCTSVHCCVHQPGCLCLRGRSGNAPWGANAIDGAKHWPVSAARECAAAV